MNHYDIELPEAELPSWQGPYKLILRKEFKGFSYYNTLMIYSHADAMALKKTFDEQGYDCEVDRV